ncbi:MAG: hypothetical protein IJ265_05505 [Oscillospiraceae bacterium]|nr:hypothetical protein [Oscillospiraceae bacterium]
MQFSWYLTLQSGLEEILNIFNAFMAENGISVRHIREDETCHAEFLCEWFVAWIGDRESPPDGYDAYVPSGVHVDYEINVQLYPSCKTSQFLDFVRFFHKLYEGDMYLEDEFNHPYFYRKDGVWEETE